VTFSVATVCCGAWGSILTFTPLSPQTPHFDQNMPSTPKQRSNHGHRLHAGQACQTCRRGKSRCDGKRPSCSGCLARDVECQYLDKSERGGFSPTYITPVELSNQRYVSLLQERIRVLEEKQNTQSVSERGQSSPQNGIVAVSNQGSTEQRPLSPASLSDGVLDLDNSGAFELLEFGMSSSIYLI
jgi:transcriptional regulatory protein CAT8